MGSMNDRNPRFTLSAAFVIAAFSTIHFVVGYALIFAWMKFGSWQVVGILGRILVNVWWFPAQQIYQLHHSGEHISRFAFPVCNSLLWGAVMFVIWKARQRQYYSFSLRTLLIATTVVAVVLGMIVYATR
jgi:uncharacterized membrane protein